MEVEEFGAAASLSRKEVNLQEELAKVIDLNRFTATISYLSGLFSQNTRIEYLNICRKICTNFLELVGVQFHPESIGCPDGLHILKNWQNIYLPHTSSMT